MPNQTAAWGIALFGIASGFAFGMTSDRVFKERRAPVIFFGFAGMAVVLGLFGLIDRMGVGPWAAALSLAVLSVFANGAHAMICGAASMDFGGRKAAATAAGLFDGMQYLASSLARRYRHGLHARHVGLKGVAVRSDPVRGGRRAAHDADLERDAEGPLRALRR